MPQHGLDLLLQRPRGLDPAAARIARAERLTAHARSIELRLGGDG